MNELPDKLPGIDLKDGLRRLNNSRKTYIRLLHDLVRDYGETATQIEQALAVGDRENAQRLAHSLKGVAGTLGVHGLGSSARDIESALRRNEEVSEEDLAKLASAIQIVTESAKRLPDQSESVSVPAGKEPSDPDLQALQKMLERISEMVERNDFNAAAEFEQFRPHLGLVPEIRPLLESIEEELSRFRYDQAGPFLTEISVELAKLMDGDSEGNLTSQLRRQGQQETESPGMSDRGNRNEPSMDPVNRECGARDQ